jgi:acetyl esterase/lipase
LSPGTGGKEHKTTNTINRKGMARIMNFIYRGLLFLLAALPLSTMAQDVVAVTGAKVIRNVSYGPSAAQVMDIYLPPHPQNAPVILMVHGGAWTLGDKSIGRVVTNKAEHWLPKGYIFISIDNRLLPAAGPLEQAHDVAKALAFAQKQARSWGGDSSRFVLMGHSAGAHLVDVLAADPQLAFDEGAKPWLGTVSLDTATLDVVDTMRSRHYGFYDAAFGKDPAYWASASPMQLLTSAPKPMLLVCSTRRPDHPCSGNHKFAAKVTQLGGTAVVLEEDLTHREINENLGLPGSYTSAADAFLHSLGLP